MDGAALAPLCPPRCLHGRWPAERLSQPLIDVRVCGKIHMPHFRPRQHRGDIQIRDREGRADQVSRVRWRLIEDLQRSLQLLLAVGRDLRVALILGQEKPVQQYSQRRFFHFGHDPDAQMMRVGVYRPVHVKTLRSQKLRMLLTHRKLLQSKAIAIENDLRGTLRNFGLKVGMVGTVRFEARIQELIETIPDLMVLVEPLLVVRRVLREQIIVLHRRLLAIVRDDEVCRRLMTTPGVGPVVALTYRATVDVPARFRKSKSVGAVFGLTCSRYQSGEIDWSGRISRCGDEMMRVMLYEAAQSMLRSKKWSWLKAWAMQIARRRGMKKAIVALARRLAVILHRIWIDGTEFHWTRETAAA